MPIPGVSSSNLSHHQLQYALSNGIIIYLLQAFRLLIQIIIFIPYYLFMSYIYTIDQYILQLMMTYIRKMCFKVYHLDPVKFISAPGLAWQAALKKTEKKL